MPDITMCMGRDCPQREKCYRFTATPNPHRQSYSAFDMGDGECDHLYIYEPIMGNMFDLYQKLDEEGLL
jgi:hypothetical protein